MRAAIYARVSTKAKSECPHCGKTVKLSEGVEGDLLVEHVDRSFVACAGSGLAVEATADRGQDTANQVHQLREYCARQGWELTAEYIDRLTGKHADRDAFKQLFADASRRMFDVVVIWALDRFTREGVGETFDHVRKLGACGIQFESYTEQHFRTTGPAGELMLAVAAWIAKQERVRISDRTKAGLQRAKRAGKQCGRPGRVFDKDEAIRLREQGISVRAIGEKLGVSFMTVQRLFSGAKGCNKKVPQIELFSR